MENSRQKLKTVKEISESKLGLKVVRIYALIREGTIPQGVVVRFGKRQIRINEQKLNEWIEQGGSCFNKD